MKKLLFVATALFAMVLSSCSNDESVDFTEQSGEKTVSVTLNGDFTFESFTRSSSSDVNTAQDIWIFDYMDGQLVQTVHQKNGDANFGNPQITLKYGKHNMYFVVSSGSEPNHMEYINIITWQSIGDTFWINATVEIDASSSSNLSVLMNRVVTMIKLKSVDIVPDNAKYIKIVPKIWHYGLNYLTGKPDTYSNNREVLYELDNNAAGSHAEVSLYGFSDNSEETTEITVYSLSGTKGVIKYNKIPSVPFKANRITSLTGWMFSTGSTGNYDYSFMLNSVWSNEYNMTW